MMADSMAMDNMMVDNMAMGSMMEDSRMVYKMALGNMKVGSTMAWDNKTEGSMAMGSTMEVGNILLVGFDNCQELWECNIYSANEERCAMSL